MKKDRIIYIGGFEFPDKNAATHRALGIAKTLKKLNYDVTFIGITKGENYIEKLEYDNFNRKYPTNKIEWIFYLINSSFYKKIIKNSNNVKAVILYNFPALLSLKILKYCKRNNIKCIGDITEWYQTTHRNLIFKIIKGVDNYFRMKIINKKLNGLIVISSFLAKYYSNRKNVILIPPLVDINDKKWILPKENPEDNFLRLLYNGNPGRKDRIDVLIKILDLVKISYKLDVVGINSKEYIDIFGEDYKSNINVIFHGKVTYKESLDFLKRTDALFFYRDDNITSNAGFPTKFVEATTCKIPVIANITSDLGMYLEDGVNGIVITEDLKENARRISNLNKENIKKMKENINQKQFDYLSYMEDVDKWLKKIITGM